MSENLTDEQLSEIHSSSLIKLNTGESLNIQTRPGWESMEYTRKSAEDIKKLSEIAANFVNDKTNKCLVCFNPTKVHAYWEHEYKTISSYNYVCEKCNFDIFHNLNYSGPWD